VEKHNAISWYVFLISIIFTLTIWIGFSSNLSSLDSEYFHHNVDMITTAIEDELGQYEQVLVGAQGFFAGSDIVDKSEWTSFAKMQNIETRFPGLQGLSYAEYTLHEDREKLISKMKSYGNDNFTIKPDGDRDEYYPVLFLEPLDDRNEKAIGYDIYFEDTRSSAINLLKETGETTITGNIILVQEIDQDVQNGFLMLSPIYSNNEPEKLQGIVDTVFRINDFVQETIDPMLFENVRLKIYDQTISDQNLFFDSNSISDSLIESSEFTSTASLSIYNRDWIFVYEGIPPPLSIVSEIILFAIPIVGFSMSVLLFYLFRVVSKNLVLSEQALKTEKISAMGTMASRMSHDLRNPLTVVKSSFELLKRHLGNDVDEKTKQLSKRIEISIDAMSSIIDDVLQFTRTSEIQKENAILNDILKNVVSNIDVPSKIRINLPKEDHSIFCDVTKIKSVFSNLLTNSIQSISGEGTIVVSIIDKPEHQIITFVDTGTGIPKESLSKIFDPLFTTKSSGTGLGLGICKNIIDQHGGTISVKNNPTTFTLKLPKR